MGRKVKPSSTLSPYFYITIIFYRTEGDGPPFCAHLPSREFTLSMFILVSQSTRRGDVFIATTRPNPVAPSTRVTPSTPSGQSTPPRSSVTPSPAPAPTSPVIIISSSSPARSMAPSTLQNTQTPPAAGSTSSHITRCIYLTHGCCTNRRWWCIHWYCYTTCKYQ